MWSGANGWRDASSVMRAQAPYFSRMSNCRSVVLLLPMLVHACFGQVAVPYTTASGQFGVFRNGRFEELEQRRPQVVFPNGPKVAYISDQGELRGWDDGQLLNYQRGEPVDVKTSRGLLAWKQGERLLYAGISGPKTLCHDAGEFTVQDSLVAYHNEVERTLCVYWRGQVTPLADVLMASEAPQWQAGSNTLTFYNRDARHVVLFYRGTSHILCENVDYARVSPGGDVVAYMDDSDDTFRVFDHGDRIDIEPFAPIDFRAGLGIVGYTSATAALRCYADHKVYSLTEFMPTAYYVQDSVITWVENGQWKTLNAGKVETLERFVPENWQVNGANIAYQDLNRELRMYHRGKRSVITKEAGVKSFELHGDAVVWQSNSGTVKVWWKGKVYERY